jgi:glycosyltransferase involved in cell wall biosynthesis
MVHGARESFMKDWECAQGERSFLSVVIAAKDEAASLPQLIKEITLALHSLVNCGPNGLIGYEIIVVDDASTDGTQSVLQGLLPSYPEVMRVVLTTGAGQSSATIAGIRAARGNWIATLDADLQNDPADLLRLWNALPGHDVALGWRRHRHDVWSKRVISQWANWVRNLVLGHSVRDTGCSVRIFPRAVALRLPAFNGFHRFLGSLMLREGCRLVQVPVRHRPRRHGRSHYNVWNRSVWVLLDLIGVAWLMQRSVRCEVVKPWESDQALSEIETVPAPAGSYTRHQEA